MPQEKILTSDWLPGFLLVSVLPSLFLSSSLDKVFSKYNFIFAVTRHIIIRQEHCKRSSTLLPVRPMRKDSDNEISKGKVNFEGKKLKYIMDLTHKFRMWRVFHCQPQETLGFNNEGNAVFLSEIYHWPFLWHLQGNRGMKARYVRSFVHYLLKSYYGQVLWLAISIQ